MKTPLMFESTDARRGLPFIALISFETGHRFHADDPFSIAPRVEGCK